MDGDCSVLLMSVMVIRLLEFRGMFTRFSSAILPKNSDNRTLDGSRRYISVRTLTVDMQRLLGQTSKKFFNVTSVFL